MEKGEEIKEERKLSRRRYLTTFALTTLIFVLGILIGNSITKYRVAEIEKTAEEIKTGLLDSEMQSYLAKEQICNTTFFPLEEELLEMSSRISYMENQYGKNDEKVLEIKKPYLLLVMKQYFLLKERKKQCNESYALILFFYSNKPEKISESEKQGYVLDYARKKYDIKVFAFDVDLGLGSIEMLESIYKIKEIPSLVIEENVHEGFQKIEMIKEILGYE